MGSFFCGKRALGFDLREAHIKMLCAASMDLSSYRLMVYPYDKKAVNGKL